MPETETKTESADPKAPASSVKDGAPTATATESSASADAKQEAAASPTTKTVSRADYLAKIEEAIAAEHAAKEREKAAATLEAKLKKYAPADEFLTKGERVAAIKAILGDKFDESLLYEVASALTPKEKTPDELFEEKFAAKEAARKAEEQRVETERNQAELNKYLTRAATETKAALDAGKFKLCKAWGIDSERFKTLLAEQAEKTGEVPEPMSIVALIEAEHTAKLKAAGITVADAVAAAEGKAEGAPAAGTKERTLEEYADAAFNRHRPKGTPADKLVIEKKLSPAEEARLALRQYDQENRERIKFGQGLA